jgi:hypothetical protein
VVPDYLELNHALVVAFILKRDLGLAGLAGFDHAKVENIWTQ